MITLSDSVATQILDRWGAFTTALTTDSLDLVGTEDVVSALIDRSLLQDDLDQGGQLEAHDLVRLDRADRAYRGAAPVLLDRTDIALYKDDEPITHWWWHIEQLVLGRASELLLNVPQAAEAKHVHPHTIRLAIKEGHLPARRLARGFLIHRRDLERWGPRRVGRPRLAHSESGDPLLDGYNEANTAGDFAAATRIARAIERDPSTPRRQLAVALAADNDGDHVAALRWSRQALAGDLPDRSRQTAQLVEGRALLAVRRATDARAVLRKAIGGGHVDALIYAALADVYLALGQTAKAVTYANLAVHAAPERVELKLLLARMEWHDDRIVDALEHVTEFRSSNPTNEAAILLYGAIMGVLGDRTGQRDCYRKVVATVGPMADRSVDAALACGTAMSRLGRLRPALALMRRLQAERGDEEGAAHVLDHIGQAVVRAVSGEGPKVALPILSELERIHGSSELVRRARATHLALAGDVDGSLAALGTTIAGAAARDPEEQQAVAIALVNAGRAPEALPLLRQLIATSDEPEILHLATKGALAAQDVAMVKMGLERLSEYPTLGGRVARTALTALGVGARSTGGQAAIATLSQTPSAASSTEQLEQGATLVMSDRGPWEGQHPMMTPILDDLMRSFVH